MVDVEGGDDAVALLDAELWAPVEESIRSAKHEILLTQLFFDPAFSPTRTPFADMLEAAARRGVRVQVLMNRNAVIPDSHDEIQERFRGTPVGLYALPMSPNVLHAKVLVVDGTVAFLIDPPFEQKYVDDSAHSSTGPVDRDKPFHSVSLRIRGPAVGRLHAIASTLLASAGAPRPPARDPPPRAGRLRLRIAHTTPAGYLAAEEEHGILDAYERAIAGAKRLIYMENQYFTSPRIRDALREALAREPLLEVILFLNAHMDVPSYDSWQDRRLREMGALDHPRMGVFHAWRARRTRSTSSVSQVYLHTKVAIIDDAWATVGSANLDSISLHRAQEFGIEAPPNIEVNAIIEDASFATALRRRLWGEHLRDNGVWQTEAPTGSWLTLWRRVAEDDLAHFESGQADMVGVVFPYGQKPQARKADTMLS